MAVPIFRQLQGNNVQRIKDVDVAFFIDDSDVVSADGYKLRVWNWIFAAIGCPQYKRAESS